MIPANQRLQSNDHSIAQAYRRLVVEHELPPLQRPRQVGLQFHPIADGNVLLGLVPLPPPLSACLRRIQGDVGVAHQVLGGVLELHLGGDPDAEPQHHLPFLDPEGSPEMLVDAFRRADRLILIEDGLHQDGELVGAESRHHLPWADDLSQAPADQAQ